MNERTIAILGCGYVGSALGAALVRSGYDVLGTTTSPARTDDLARLGITPSVLELADEDRLRSALSDRRAVFLMVAPGRTERTYAQVYLDGAGHVLRAIGGSGVRHLVYTSSTSVYGQRDGSWVDEDSATDPHTESGQILVAAERKLLAGAAALGITATVLRLAGICGPSRGPINRVPRLAGRPRDDGDAYVNLIHRDDIVSACTALLDTPYHGILNLACDTPLRRRDLYDPIVAAAGLAPIQWTDPDPPPDLGKRVHNQRIKQELGLKLRHPTPDACAFF